MPKQVFDGKKCSVVLDDADPKDKLEQLKHKHLGKKGTNLTKQEAEEIGRAYVDAGVITL